MGERRCLYRIFLEKPEGNRPLGRPRLGWDDNIKVVFQEVEWRGMDWIDLSQDRHRWQAFVKAVMNVRDPQNAGNF